MLPKFNNL